MKKSPVVMIGYSRKNTLLRSLHNLSQCEDVKERDVYLFLDAPYRPEDTGKCQQMADSACEFRDSHLQHLKIIRRPTNYGVPGNLISAVNEILERYGRVIFFEDDVLVSRTFLRFMDEALDYYENDKRIWCINGNRGRYLKVPRDYAYDVYLSPRNLPWGWGTWKDRWMEVDFSIKDWPQYRDDIQFRRKIDQTGEEMWRLLEGVYKGEIRTWDVQCTFYMIKNSLFSIEPRHALTKNIGFSSLDAVNCCGRNMAMETAKYYNFLPRLVSDLAEDSRIMSGFEHAWCDVSLHARIVRKLHRICLGLGPRYDEPLEITR